MRVHLDTSLFPSDFGLKNAELRALLEGAQQLGIQVVLSTVVVEELVAHFREALEVDWATVQTGVRRLGRNMELAGVFWAPTEADIPAATGRYREALRRRLDDLQVHVAPIPNVSHAALLERDLSRRLPFRKIGKEASKGQRTGSLGTVGYRDALIWETVLEDAESNPDIPIVLITTNASDFADGDDSLHPHLRADLEKRGLTGDCVRLYTSFKRFSERHITPQLQTVAELLGAIESGRVPLLSWLTEEAGRLQGADALDLQEFGIKGYQLVTVDRVVGVRDASFRTPRRLDDGFYLEGTAFFDLQVVVAVNLEAFANLAGLELASRDTKAIVEGQESVTVFAEFSATVGPDYLPRAVSLSKVLELDPSSPLGQLQAEADKSGEPSIQQIERLWQQAEAGSLRHRDLELLHEMVMRADYASLKAAHVPPTLMASRIIEDLSSRNWYTQNPAIQALRDLGLEQVANLPASVQEEVGRNVLQAADGGAFRAQGLLNELLAFAPPWPRAFVEGVILETLVNHHQQFRLKGYLQTAITIVSKHPDAEPIGRRVFAQVHDSSPKSGPYTAGEDVGEACRLLDDARQSGSTERRHLAAQLLSAVEEAASRWVQEGLVHEDAWNGKEDDNDDPSDPLRSLR